MTTLTVYIGRDNVDQLKLMKQGVVIPNDTATKAELSFGDWCIDTDVDTNIRLATNATVVEMEIGLTAGITAGKYEGLLTIYDAGATNGIAWGTLQIEVKDWVVC